MTHELPNGIQGGDVSSPRASNRTPRGSVVGVLRDELTAKRYSPCTSLLVGFAATAIILWLARVLAIPLPVHTVVLGVVCGLVLYELARKVAVHSGWLPSRTRSRPIESTDLPAPRHRR
jgi:hypothetical protein